MARIKKFSTLLWLVLCLTLTACGGGGGGGDDGGGGGSADAPPADDSGSDGGGDGGSGSGTGDDGGDGSGDGADGGDSDGDGTAEGPTTPDGHTDAPVTARQGPPTLTADANVKTLALSWDVDESDDHYHIYEAADGAGDYETLVNLDEGSSYNQEIAVHQINWSEASYVMRVCDGDHQCISSAPIGINDLMLDAIGEFAAANTDAEDQFGYSVDISGDGSLLVVGAPYEDGSAASSMDAADENTTDAGAVYVFGSTDEGWRQLAYLKAGNAGADDRFGTSVAISGDGSTIVVGAPGEASASAGATDDTAANAGAAYVFSGSAGEWTQEAYLKASTPDAEDAFGSSVAIDETATVVAVGAPGEDSSADGTGGDQTDDTAESAGAAYVFSNTGGGWSPVAYVKASNSEAEDGFGTAVALSDSGATLAVSAPGEDGAATTVNGDGSTNGATDSGAAYLFSADSNWQQHTYLKAADTADGTALGSALAIAGAGHTVAAGASEAVYVFTGGDTWSQQAKLKGSNTAAGDAFGHSVSLNRDGTMLVVGATGEDSTAVGVNGDEANASATDAGAAYVFELGETEWAQSAYVKSPTTAPDAAFGSSVSLDSDGSSLAVGASGKHDGAGAAFLY